MTDHTYTVAHLQDIENGADLRLLAGEVLNPGKSGHTWEWPNCHCAKCGIYRENARPPQHEPGEYPYTLCPVPDPATDSLPEIAEQLLRQVVANDRLPELEGVILTYPMCNALGFVNVYRELLLLSPTDRAICCLLVLLPGRVIVE